MPRNRTFKEEEEITCSVEKQIKMIKRITNNSLRRSVFNLRVPLSTAAQPVSSSEERLQIFRTNQSDPTKHDSNHLGQYYTIPPADKARLFAHGGLTKTFEIQAKTFNETCLMVRQPALDVITCLNAIDYSKPAVRFVIYGRKGSGKSMSLAHLLHYAYKKGFLLVHVPWVGNWMRRCQESSNSATKEGQIDINIDAAAWLVHFKNQNLHLLEGSTLTVTQDYEWSKREKTVKDAKLLELVEHGINRVKYASDCIVAIAEEVKRLSTAGKCRTLVAVDGFNALFYPHTRIKTEKKEIVHPFKVVPTEAFLNLSNYDWNNGVVVVTLDEIAIAEEDQVSHLPRYLLGKKGFEHLDPFVPILVPNYSQKEVKSCLEYYKERKWIRTYPGQEDELAFISGSNPYKLLQLCEPL